MATRPPHGDTVSSKKLTKPPNLKALAEQTTSAFFGVYCDVLDPSAINRTKTELAQHVGGTVLVPTLVAIFSHGEVLGDRKNAVQAGEQGIIKSMHTRLEQALEYAKTGNTSASFSRLAVANLPYTDTQQRLRLAVVAELAGTHPVNNARQGARHADPRTHNSPLSLTNIRGAYVPLVAFDAFRETTVRATLKDIGPEMIAGMGAIVTQEHAFVLEVPGTQR